MCVLSMSSRMVRVRGDGSLRASQLWVLLLACCARVIWSVVSGEMTTLVEVSDGVTVWAMTMPGGRAASPVSLVGAAGRVVAGHADSIAS